MPGASAGGPPGRCPTAAGGLARGRGGTPQARPGLGLSRQFYGEGGAATGSLGDPDVSAVGVGHGGHDGETQAGAALRTDSCWVRAPETLEHVRRHLGRDPRAVVDDEDSGAGGSEVR